MTDAALDLSAKSKMLDMHGFSKHLLFSNLYSSPGYSSLQRSTSSCSDDSDSSTNSTRKPVLGPRKKISLDSKVANSNANFDQGARLLSESLSTPFSIGVSRTLKNYSNASMTSISSATLHDSQMCTSTSSLSAGFGAIYDASTKYPPIPYTQLTSHSQQRKRRTGSRSGSNQWLRSSDLESKIIQSLPEENKSDFYLAMRRKHIEAAKLSDSNQGLSCSDTESKKFHQLPEENKDDYYWERRRKNNEAAKRSRDNRRQKEEKIAKRAAHLEKENLKLKAEVAFFKTQVDQLRYMLCNSCRI